MSPITTSDHACRHFFSYFSFHFCSFVLRVTFVWFPERRCRISSLRPACWDFVTVIDGRISVSVSAQLRGVIVGSAPPLCLLKSNKIKDELSDVQIKGKEETK